MKGLILRGVTKSFAGKQALGAVDLTVPTGSFTAIVGPSGCGKSTLLRLIGGLTEATEGHIEMDGITPLELRRRKEVGWMAQRPALLPWKRVIDNVALAQSINPRSDRALSDPVELLAMVGLADVADSYPSQLSGGMQQRVALARTLAVGASLWLMDEPFSSLDELTREALAADLLTIWTRISPTTLWVTHHVPEAVMLADRLVVMSPSPGRIAGVVDVDLPRPRDVTSPRFQEIVRQARSLLLETRPQAVPA